MKLTSVFSFLECEAVYLSTNRTALYTENGKKVEFTLE